MVAGVTAGTVAIVATAGGKVAAASVTVKSIPVGTVAITPKADTLTPGAQTQLSVTVKDSLGNVIQNPAVTWTSTVTAVALVNGSGLVIGTTPGVAQIIAQSGSKADTNTTTVIPAPTASITITPNPVTVIVGQTAVLTATQKDANGNVLSGRSVTWQSAAPSTVTVSAGGIDPVTQLDTCTASGVAAGGPVSVVAQTGNITASTQVTVSNVPVAYVVVTPNLFTVDVRFTRQVAAKAYDANNNLLTGRQFTWTTKSGGSISTVDPTGLVTGVAAGADSVYAATGGKTGSGAVTVALAPVSTVIVAPTTTTITAAQTAQLSDTVKDSQGDTLQGRTVTWSSSNTGIATVSASGLVSPTGLNDSGTVTITATSSGIHGTATVTIAQDPVTNVTVSPSSSTINASQTQQLTAVLKDASGATLTGRPVAWSSSNPSVATVSNTGLVSPTGLNDTGTVTITASSGSANGNATVTIGLDPVASVHVAPTNASITASQTQQLTATLKDAAGTTLTGRTVTWTSSDPTIATVSNTGLVTPTGANDSGAVTITASSGGKNGAVVVTITQDPVASVAVSPLSSSIAATQTQQLTATLKDSSGTVLTGRTVTWASSNPSVATVSASGLVSPTGLNDTGTVTITATSGSANGTATVTITADPVTSVTVAPGSSTIAATQTQQLAATLKDAGGTVLTGRPITWLSSNPSVATVSASGLVSPTGLNDTGTVTITATSGGASGTATVTINPDPVANVTVAPPSSSIAATQTQQLTATLKDAGGTVLTGRTVTWSSSNTGVATVSATGLVSPTGLNDTGTVTITATSGAASGTATVTITQDPVASVTVAPPSSSIAATLTQQLTATLKDAGGTVLTGRTVTWSSSNTDVATVSATGLVSPTGVNDTGTVTITATSGTASGTATVTITQDPVASVTVAPPTSTITTAQTQQLGATLKDAGGTVLTGRSVTWSSGNPGIATVSNTGLVQPVGPVNDTGTVTITATSGTASGTATVNVASVPATGVSVNPPSATIFATSPSNQIQLGATTTPAGIGVTWSNGGSSAASVDGNGLVTATGAAAGPVTITATSSNSPASGSSTITVIAHVGSVTVNAAGNDTLSLSTAMSTTANATLLDTFGTDVSAQREVTWTSSDGSTIQINGGSGPFVANPATTVITLQAVSTNSASVIITATTDDGASGSIIITVSP